MGREQVGCVDYHGTVGADVSWLIRFSPKQVQFKDLKAIHTALSFSSIYKELQAVRYDVREGLQLTIAIRKDWTIEKFLLETAKLADILAGGRAIEDVA